MSIVSKTVNREIKNNTVNYLPCWQQILSSADNVCKKLGQLGINGLANAQDFS